MNAPTDSSSDWWLRLFDPAEIPTEYVLVYWRCPNDRCVMSNTPIALNIDEMVACGCAPICTECDSYLKMVGSCKVVKETDR